MKLKKKILAWLPAIVFIFSLSGCVKCISTEYKDVEVVVVNEYYRGSYITPTHIGKVTTFVTHPAVYEITVEYNGVEYTIDERGTYDKYKNKIGQTTIGKLEIRSYDDDSVKYNIVSLE